MNTESLDTVTMIGTLATFAYDVDKAESTFKNKREALIEAMATCRTAGISFMLQARDGKAKADKCQNRKALKEALVKLGYKEGRAGQVMGMLILYYESNTPPSTFMDYDSVYAAIGKTGLARLNITPKSTAPNGSTVKDAAEQAGKSEVVNGKVKSSRMPKLTPVWAIYDALMQHEDAALFTAWLATDRKQTLQAYVESAKGDALNRQRIALLEAELAKLKAV